MKATDFNYTSQEIQSRIFAESLVKRLKWIELNQEQKDAVNAYPCEIVEHNGMEIIFIDGFAEVSHPEYGQFWAKGENVEIVREFIKTGRDFNVNGFNEITK